MCVSSSEANICVCVCVRMSLEVSEKHFHAGLDGFVCEELLCSPEGVSEVTIYELGGCDAHDWVGSGLLNLPQHVTHIKMG